MRTALILAAAALAIVTVVDVRAERGEDVASGVLGLSLPKRLAAYVVLATLVFLSFVTESTGGGFLYANF